MSHVTLHGRSDDLRTLTAVQSGLVVISGDSGIGKSELLAGLESGWQKNDLVAGASVLGATQGSLQTAFVDAVGDCLRQYVGEHPESARTLWVGLGGLLDRAASATAREVGGILIARIFTSIEHKLGKELALVAREALSESLRPESDGLDDRLQRLMLPDLATDLISVASDASTLTGHRLVLRFDRGELLNSADLALLGEVADRSIESLLILTTFSTSQPHSSAALAILETRGAKPHNLSPLKSPAIREWLAAENVAPETWGQLSRLSSGYPFFLQDAIRLSKDGRQLDQLSAPNGFDALLRLAWKSLDPAMQLLAMKVAGFADPPTDVFLAEYLRIDALAWSTTRNQLVSAGVFISRPDGSTWFHDRRRNYIWLEIMTCGDRAITSDASIEALRVWHNEHPDIGEWSTSALPSLLRAAAKEIEDESYLGKLIHLTVDELCILFALIELVEPAGSLGPFADTSLVGGYASTRFGRPVDPIASLERLARLGLISSSANEDRSISAVIIPDALTYAALLAELEQRLHQRPVPRFASTIFLRVLRPILGAFQAASMSVGDGSLRSHRDAHQTLSQSGPRAMCDVPALGIVVRIDGQSVAATVTFQKIEERDSACARLAQYEAHRGTLEPEIASAVTLPRSRVRHGRYSELAKRLGLDRVKEPVASADDITARVGRRVRIVETIRRHFTEEEASSFGWREPLSTLVDVRDEQTGWAEISIAGCTEGELREFTLPDGQWLLKDPLLELKLRRDGLLRPGERVTRWTVHGGSSKLEAPHPLQDVSEDLKKLGRSYNRNLEQVLVELDEVTVARAIRSERDIERRILEDLRAGSLIDESDDGRLSASLHVFLQIRSADGLGTNWFAYHYEVHDGIGEVTVKVLPPDAPSPEWRPSAEEATAMGISDEALISHSGRGFADAVLAGLLGFDVEDIQLPRTKYWPRLKG